MPEPDHPMEYWTDNGGKARIFLKQGNDTDRLLFERLGKYVEEGNPVADEIALILTWQLEQSPGFWLSAAVLDKLRRDREEMEKKLGRPLAQPRPVP